MKDEQEEEKSQIKPAEAMQSRVPPNSSVLRVVKRSKSCDAEQRIDPSSASGQQSSHNNKSEGDGGHLDELSSQFSAVLQLSQRHKNS